MANDLPNGWRATADLDLDRPWAYIEVESYLYGQFTHSEYLDNVDDRSGVWRLTPDRGWFYPAPECTHPDQAGEPRSLPDESWTDKSTTAVESYAMDEAQFWTIIDAAVASEATVSGALVAQLGTLPQESLRAFQGRLVLEFIALDTAANWDRSERQRAQESVYGDTATYFAAYRCALILQGQSVADAADTFSWPTDSVVLGAEGILDSAGFASEKTYGQWDLTRVPTIPPMGSNGDGW